MSTSTSDHKLADELDDVIELRPFPATASRVMTACRSADVTAGEISEIISHDPALSLKLLQIANSPLYGFSDQICSVQHATVVIGLRALKNLALFTAVEEVFGDGDVDTERTRNELWTHSLACGSMARTMAAVTGLAVPEEAFLAGVVHDVGKLLFVDRRPEEYQGMPSGQTGESVLEAELEVFGIAHTTVGGACGRTWGLPDEINDVICFHHEPEESDFGGDLVNAANQLTRIWDTDAVHSQDAGCVLTEHEIDLSPEEIDGLQERAVSELNALRAIQSNS